jgi:hypothetical protein
MKKQGFESSPRRSAKSGMTLGRDRFAKISALEGVELTASMRKRAAEFDRLGVPAAERRRAIVRAYSKS